MIAHIFVSVREYAWYNSALVVFSTHLMITWDHSIKMNGDILFINIILYVYYNIKQYFN